MSRVMVGKWVKQFDACQTDVHDKKWIKPQTSHNAYIITCFSIFTDSILILFSFLRSALALKFLQVV